MLVIDILLPQDIDPADAVLEACRNLQLRAKLLDSVSGGCVNEAGLHIWGRCSRNSGLKLVSAE